MDDMGAEIQSKTGLVLVPGEGAKSSWDKRVESAEQSGREVWAGLGEQVNRLSVSGLRAALVTADIDVSYRRARDEWVKRVEVVSRDYKRTTGGEISEYVNDRLQNGKTRKVGQKSEVGERVSEFEKYLRTSPEQEELLRGVVQDAMEMKRLREIGQTNSREYQILDARNVIRLDNEEQRGPKRRGSMNPVEINPKPETPQQEGEKRPVWHDQVRTLLLGALTAEEVVEQIHRLESFFKRSGRRIDNAETLQLGEIRSQLRDVLESLRSRPDRQNNLVRELVQNSRSFEQIQADLITAINAKDIDREERERVIKSLRAERGVLFDAANSIGLFDDVRDLLSEEEEHFFAANAGLITRDEYREYLSGKPRASQIAQSLTGLVGYDTKMDGMVRAYVDTTRDYWDWAWRMSEFSTYSNSGREKANLDALAVEEITGESLVPTAKRFREAGERMRREQEDARRRLEEEERIRRQEEQRGRVDTLPIQPEGERQPKGDLIMGRLLHVFEGNFFTSATQNGALIAEIDGLSDVELGNYSRRELHALRKIAMDISRPVMQKEIVAGTPAGYKSFKEKMSELTTYEFSTGDKGELALVLSGKGVLIALGVAWRAAGLNLETGEFTRDAHFWSRVQTQLPELYQNLEQQLLEHPAYQGGDAVMSRAEARKAVRVAMGIMMHSNELALMSDAADQFHPLNTSEKFCVMHTQKGIELYSQDTVHALHMRLFDDQLDQPFELRDGRRTTFTAREVLSPEIGVESWLRDRTIMGSSRGVHASILEMVQEAVKSDRPDEVFSQQSIEDALSKNPFFKYQKKMGAVYKVFDLLMPTDPSKGGLDATLTSHSAYDVALTAANLANNLYLHNPDVPGKILEPELNKLARFVWLAKGGMYQKRDLTNMNMLAAWRESIVPRRGMDSSLQFKDWNFQKGTEETRYVRFHYQDDEFANFLEKQYRPDNSPEMDDWFEKKLLPAARKDREYQDVIYLFKTFDGGASASLEKMKKSRTNWVTKEVRGLVKVPITPTSNRDPLFERKYRISTYSV